MPAPRATTSVTGRIRAPSPRPVAGACRSRIAVASSRVDELADWDLVLVMDRDNLRDVQRLAGDRADLGHVRLLRSFDPDVAGARRTSPTPTTAPTPTSPPCSI